MIKIRFFSEEISFKPKNITRLRAWIEKIVEGEKYELVGLNYIFCSDEYLYRMNASYLRHQSYTDIITFDNADKSGIINADIYISIDRVKENARQLEQLFEKELHRVMIHGVLHLTGYKDKTPTQQTAMREKEEACLSLLLV